MLSPKPVVRRRRRFGSATATIPTRHKIRYRRRRLTRRYETILGTPSPIPAPSIDGHAMDSSIARSRTHLTLGPTVLPPPERRSSNGSSRAKRWPILSSALTDSTKARPLAVQKPEPGVGRGTFAVSRVLTLTPARACPSMTLVFAPCSTLGFGESTTVCPAGKRHSPQHARCRRGAFNPSSSAPDAETGEVSQGRRACHGVGFIGRRAWPPLPTPREFFSKRSQDVRRCLRQGDFTDHLCFIRGDLLHEGC